MFSNRSLYFDVYNLLAGRMSPTDYNIALRQNNLLCSLNELSDDDAQF